MKIRNRFVMFLLMYIFEIIYILYWICSVQKGIYMEKACVNQSDVNSMLTLLLIIGTFGLYYFVWQWLTCDYLKREGAEDFRILTLLLSILLIGIIVNPLLIQGQINKVVKEKYPALQHVA